MYMFVRMCVMSVQIKMKISPLHIWEASPLKEEKKNITD